MQNRLLILFIVLLLGFAVSFFAITGQFNPQTIGVLIFFLIFIPTLIKPDIGFIIIIVSMLFSPELIVGATTGREVTIRIEDILLLVVILAWFIRTTFTKDMTKVFKTNLTVPIFLYLGVCVLSTVLASILSEIDLRLSFLSILKYLEYFLLFFMVKDNLRNLSQIKLFVAVFLLVALLVTIHSNVFIQQKQAAHEAFFRVGTPGERRPGGEPGTLGGYLILMMGLAAGLLLHTRSLPLRIFLICLEFLMFRAFLYTLSRGSYLAFIFMAIGLAFFSRKSTVVYLLIIVSILALIFMPQMVRERITGTVLEKSGVEGSYLELEESPQGRIESWKFVLSEWLPASPIFGHGVAKYFVDGQIFLTLTEVGIVGLILLIWIWVRLFKMLKNVFYKQLAEKNEFCRGLSLGFLTGFVGLIGQALSTNTFIIIRIMEPFWFIAAIVLSLPQLIPQEEEITEKKFG